MSDITLARSYCWHCHAPLEHRTGGAHNPCRSEAVAECPSCGSVFKIVAAMEALSGPAVQTFHVAVNELKGAPRSRFERGPVRIQTGI